MTEDSVLKESSEQAPSENALDESLEVVANAEIPSPQPSPDGRGSPFSLGEKVRMRASSTEFHCKSDF